MNKLTSFSIVLILLNMLSACSRQNNAPSVNLEQTILPTESAIAVIPTQIEPSPTQPLSEKTLVQINEYNNHFLTGKIIFEHNKEGLISNITYQSINPSGKIEHEFSRLCSYDTDHRLLQYGVPDGVASWAEYIYDRNGHLIEMSKGEGGWERYTYTNDELGRPIKQTVETDLSSEVTEFTYNNDNTQVDVVITRTDYDGLVSTENARYTFSYNAEGNILSEIRDGSDFSYHHIFSYDYKPFVAVADVNALPYEFSINDIMGNPIWSYNLWSPVQNLQTDTDGYLVSFVDAYGTSYELIYE